ncbi:MAG: ATP-binding protein [Methylomonas sp.]|jgi:PAS domain S-box-containing protein
MTKGAQDILFKHNAQWLMDVAADAMLVAGAGGDILLVNSAAERLFGYTRDEFAALGVEDLIPPRFRALHGEKRADYTAHPIARTMGDRLDIVGLRRDGAEFAANVSLTPLEEGLVLAMVYDITRAKQSELALVEAREFAESIVATLQEALVVLDAEARVVSANQVFYRAFRLNEQDTLGRVFFELNERQWDIPELRQLLAEVLPNKKWVEAFELRREFPGIGSRTVLIGARLIEWKSDRPALTLLTFLNITERKRLEAEQVRMIHELKNANEELINFAYVVSHDLKAPLRAIGSLADWIAADQRDKLDTDGQEHLRLLIQRVKRMDALIDGVLRYSRIGRINEDDVTVDLDVLVHEVIDLLAPPAHISVAVKSGLPVIRMEKTAIHQVFQNLIANAIRYQDKPEGRIEIGWADRGESWCFSVADNGPGIQKRHFERIFQLFQTLNPRDRVESTGVGLAIVKKIAEQCGGHVWVESVPGQGATFFFTLPKTIPQTPEGQAQHERKL